MTEKLLSELPDKNDIDRFWDTVELPHQEEDANYPLVNPVVASEWFAKKTTDIAYYGGLAEILTEQIENLKVHRRRKEVEFAKFRRRILANVYDKITKSADKEIQAAFLLKAAREAGKEAELDQLEEELEQIVRQIEVREPRRDQLYARLKSMKESQDAARQYLDYNKLEMRIQQRV